MNGVEACVEGGQRFQLALAAFGGKLLAFVLALIVISILPVEETCGSHGHAEAVGVDVGVEL